MILDWQKGDLINHRAYGERGIVTETRQLKGKCGYSTRNIVTVKYGDETVCANQEQLMKWGHKLMGWGHNTL